MKYVKQFKVEQNGAQKKLIVKLEYFLNIRNMLKYFTEFSERRVIF